MEDMVRLPGGALPELYFVDLDGTLLDTSSERYFLSSLFRSRRLGSREMARFLVSYMIHPARTATEGKGWNRSYLKGLSLETVESEAERCAAVLAEKNLREWTLKSVNGMRESRCRTVLLSASLEPLAAAIARRVPFDLIRASRPEVTREKLTGLLEGARPWGKSKRTLMREICDEYDANPENCAAAGDSWADRFILEECGCPVAVCPDRKLGKLARDRGWHIVEGRHTKWA